MNEITDHVDKVPIERIVPGPFQPRRRFNQERLEELAASIKSVGVLQPIVVRKSPPSSDHYEIIAGERRWRAAGLAGLAEIPCIVLSGVSEKLALTAAMTENLQREDLSPIEESMGYRRMCEELDLTHEDLAATVGKSRVYITNMMRLLSVAPKVQAYLDEGQLQTGHVKVLIGLPTEIQIAIADKAIRRGLSVRAVELLVAAEKKKGQGTQAPVAQDDNLKMLEQELSERFGTPVRIHWGKEKKIEISLSSLEQAEGVIEKLRAGPSGQWKDEDFPV